MFSNLNLNFASLICKFVIYWKKFSSYKYIYFLSLSLPRSPLPPPWIRHGERVHAGRAAQPQHRREMRPALLRVGHGQDLWGGGEERGKRKEMVTKSRNIVISSLKKKINLP